MDDLRSAAAAEALGTLLLVLVGCGAIVVEGRTGALGHPGVSLVWGLAVAVLVYALGPRSGAHFNPAVTLAFALAGRFPWRRVMGYAVAQALGAAAAVLALVALFGRGGGLGAPRTAPSIGPVEAAAVETAITFLLAFTILAVAAGPRAHPSTAGLAIGMAVAVGALVGGPLTGGGMNPVRDLAPAIAEGGAAAVLPHVAGAFLGASLAALAHRLLGAGDASSGGADGQPEVPA